MRYERAFSERWGFLLRADVGGFGVSSDVTWQLAPTISFQASERLDVVFGYRVFDVEYDDSNRDSTIFVYDIQQKGVFGGVSFGWGGGPRA